MNDFTVKRRLTEVIPNSVELGNKINKVLNILFISWSIIVIIMYFSGVDLPNYIDVTVSMIAIGISISHQLYNYIAYRNSNIRKIGIAPISTQSTSPKSLKTVAPIFKSNIDSIDLDKIKVSFNA